MISENIVRSILVTVLLILSLGRLFILYRYPSNQSQYKADLVLYALFYIFFALLTRLFQSDRLLVQSEVLFQVTLIFPLLHAVGGLYIGLNYKESPFRLTILQYLYIIFQQRENPNTPRLLRIIYPYFITISAIAKVAFSFIRTFLLSSIYLGGLFILSIDYLSIAIQYQWLFQQLTLGRAQL